ncbi:leucine-rich repeat extensin-like protein 4 [Aristolochia californica]|uniref:leucine-rich repeat extensin-like protein 4 n=1 Tax=Aristolochia californica TaxID=171875 RepID=UPI0035D5FEE1
MACKSSSSSFSSASVTTLTIILIVLRLVFRCHSESTTHHHHHHHRDQERRAIPNPRLHEAFLALQEWKLVIYSDPSNLTSDWVGPDVCNYFGVFCAPAPDDPSIQVVASIDLNHGDIAGFLPDGLGRLSYLAVLHLNSNRFCGVLPPTFVNLTSLFELDLSNNRFVGPFPSEVLSLPSLKYLDLRFNEFEGPLPSSLFARDFDAIFINNNRLTSIVPNNIGSSTASVMVFANNNFGGPLPPSIAKLANSLEELLLINTNLSGCLPEEVGLLYKVKVFDVSFNKLIGPIPYSVAALARVEQLNFAHNMMSGVIPSAVCALPNLMNFTASYNFFWEEEYPCQNLTSKAIPFDDRRNCLPDRPLQRSKKQCEAFLRHPAHCHEY